jgi:hypothetical protein
MLTRAFLEAVWPPTGIYCIAVPWTPPGTTVPVYVHKTFASIDDAIKEVHSIKQFKNVFFAVHTLVAAKVWNPNKFNRATGAQGANETRTHANMKEARSFFWDLDVGEGDGKYETKEAALSALQRFLFITGLPAPLVTSSGGGLHVYWRIATAIPSMEWKKTAARLHALGEALDMRNDPMRTIDQSSVLRVVGTFNLKLANNPRPVVVLHEGVETPNADFITQVKTLAKEYGVKISVKAPRPVDPDAIPDNTIRSYTGPTTGFADATRSCKHLENYVRAHGNVGEPLWKNSIATYQFVEFGQRVIDRFDKGHPKYDPAKTQDKLVRWNRETGGTHPPRCETFDREVGGGVCALCPNRGLGINPLDVTNKRLKRTPAITPAQSQALAASNPKYHPVIIDPEKPFARVAKGIMYTRTVDKKVVDTIIIPYDMYPIADYRSTNLVSGYSVWAVTIPLAGQRIVEFANNLFSDPKALNTELIKHGLYVDHKHLDAIRTFMNAYIRSLQERQRASKQRDHLGWNANHTKFIMPRATLYLDGSETPTALSNFASPTLLYIKQNGTLEGSIKTLEFYNRDQYLPQQFAIMCSLASPLFYATGLGGSILSLEGKTGGSKSTGAYAAASIWGYPWEYVLSATKGGSTTNARDTRMITYANFPFILDEITGIGADELRQSAYQWCQFGEKEKLKPDSTPKPIRSEAKSLILIVTSNIPLQDIISNNNMGGTASNMRIFEVRVPKANDPKSEADQFLRDLHDHYGWIGPTFMRAIMPFRDSVTDKIISMQRKFDKDYSIQGEERHLSALIASAITVGRFAKGLGLLPYDWKKVLDWVATVELPLSRGVVGSQVSSNDPKEMLVSFLYAIHAKTLRVQSSGSANIPENDDKILDIQAHYDMFAQKIYVRKDAFREHCKQRQSISSQQILTELYDRGVVTSRDLNFTLGKGTSAAKGQSHCFVVDLKHPEMTGVTP